MHWPPCYYLDDEVFSAANMLPAAEIEFESNNVNHPDEVHGITNMDIDEESAAGNNFIYIVYKISFMKNKILT